MPMMSPAAMVSMFMISTTPFIIIIFILTNAISSTCIATPTTPAPMPTTPLSTVTSSPASSLLSFAAVLPAA